MMIVRRDHVRMLPVVSVSLAVLVMVGIGHAIVVKGEPAGRVLLWVSLPVVLLLAYAVLTTCRVERRGDRILWGGLRLRHAYEARRCRLQGVSQQGARAWHLTVELWAGDEAVLDVVTLTEDGTADAKARRIADALGLAYERASEPSPAS